MPADYPDWGALAALQTFITDLNLASSTLQATASQIADEIAATGVPLIGAPVALYNTGYTVISAGASDQVIDNAAGSGMTAMSQYLSFDLHANQTCGYLNTVPFATYTLHWYADSAGDYELYRETWTTSLEDSGAGTNLVGSGPVRGAYLQVTVTNESGSYSFNINALYLYGNSRPAPEPVTDLFTYPTQLATPGFTVCTAGVGTDGLVGYWAGTLAASGTVNLLAGLKFGQLFMGVIASGTSPALTVQPQAFVTGAGLTDTGQSATYDATPGSLYVNAIRSPTVLALTNTNGSDSVNYKIALVAVKTA